MRTLCRLEEIPDGAARGFGPAPGGFTGLFGIRQGDAVHAGSVGDVTHHFVGFSIDHHHVRGVRDV